MFALDSGALLAVIKFEDGAASTRQILRDNKGQCVIHAVNLMEIYYGCLREGGSIYADKVLNTIDRAGIAIRNDLDIEFLRDTSYLKVNHKMSLGDTFGIALARRLDCEFVSTDHHELDAVHAAGVCRVNFIR